MQNKGMQISSKHSFYCWHLSIAALLSAQFCKLQNLTFITCLTIYSETRLRVSRKGGGRPRGSSTSQNSALTHRRTVMRPAYLMIRTDESHQLIRVWSPWHCVVRADWRTDVLSSGVGLLPAWIMTLSNPVNWKALRVTLSAVTSTSWSNCSG